MKTLIVLFLAVFSCAVAQEPVRPEQTGVVPLTADSRPSAWMVEHAKSMAEADQLSERRVGELADAFKDDFYLIPEYRQQRAIALRKSALNKSIEATAARQAAMDTLVSNVEDGKDNSYGWNIVAPGLEIKLIPGWKNESVITTQKLIKYSGIDVDMMKMLRPYTTTRWMQPILIRADKKKVEAFKCTIAMYDRFGELIVDNNALRCDSVTAEKGVWLMEWTVGAPDGKDFVNDMGKKLIPLGFAIPFAVTDIVVIAPQK